MNIENLRGFVTVAETLNFRSAAERLFLSQPALSRQIAELEKELGAPLLERTTHYVRLTPEGEACLDSAGSVIRIWDAMHDQILRAGEERTASLRVGIYGAPTFQYLSDSLERFRQKYPQVELETKSDESDRLIEGLKSGELDAVCMIAPELTTTPQIERVILAEEHPSVLMPVTHPLADRESIDPTELAGERFITPTRRRSPDMYEALRAIFTQTGIEPNIIAMEDDDRVAVMRVLGGEGLCLRPTDWKVARRAIPLWEVPEGVALIPLKCDNMPFARVAAWKKSNRNPALRQFVSILRKDLKEKERAV